MLTCGVKIGIGQRAIFVETEEGNVLWDCVPFIDDRFIEEVRFACFSYFGVEPSLHCFCLCVRYSRNRI